MSCKGLHSIQEKRSKKKEEKQEVTYKNKEGYPDPTQGDALNGVRREEKQRLLEKKHGFKRGEKVVTIKMLRDEMHKEAKKKKITYTVVELYPHCILLENQKGRICPPYAKLRKMMEGTDE